MAASVDFSSTQTALALIAPAHLRAEINTIRSSYDKAYGKWEPHINLIYPFVSLSALSTTIVALQEALDSERAGKLKVAFDNFGAFEHRRNTTLYLKPTASTQASLRRLRTYLTSCLRPGRKDEDGDNFHPHMTLGQASLNDLEGIETLEQKARTLLPMQWEASSLVFLKRTPAGDMVPVQELEFGDPGTQEPRIEEDRMDSKQSPTVQKSIALRGWKPCFRVDSNSQWTVPSDTNLQQIKSSDVLIASLNMMIEEHAPEFEHRLPILEKHLTNLVTTFDNLPKILCLQEVNSDMLALMFATPFFRDTFPYTSHSNSSSMPNLRNLVVLSSVPFRHFTLQYAQRHKSSLIIKCLDYNLTVVDIHLTSALTDSAVNTKKEQLEKLEQFLLRNGLESQSVLAGDFNITTSSETISSAIKTNVIRSETVQTLQSIIDPGIWRDAYVDMQEDQSDIEDDDDVFPGEEGATFDRLNNQLAAMSISPLGNRPQRYDRILYPHHGSVEVEKYGMFAVPCNGNELFSDHFGIYSIVSVNQDFEAKKAPFAALSTKLTTVEIIQLMEDDTDIESLISSTLPSNQNKQRRQEALEILRNTLASATPLRDILIAPLGSYAMDTYFAKSDLDVLVIGSVSPQAFFNNAANYLQGDSNMTRAHLINSLVQVMEVTISDIKFDIQYCQSPETIQRYQSSNLKHDLDAVVFDEAALEEMKPNSLRPLNTYRDTAYILRTIHDLPTFRIAHRFLSLYLRRRGLYSAKFGYLGGIHLTLMLNRVMKLLEQGSSSNIGTLKEAKVKITPATLIRAFLDYYSRFNWSERIVIDPSQEEKASNYKRTHREPVVIRSIFSPTARPNVAESCTRSSAQTMTKEFELACEKLKNGQWRQCLGGEQDSLSDFLNGADIFIRVKVDMWDIDKQTVDQISDMLGYMESHMPTVLVALGRVPDLQARVWPARFSTAEHSATAIELTGYYLVGISSSNDDNEEPDPDRTADLRGKILSAARMYERLVQQHVSPGQNSSKFTWITVDVVSKKKVWDMSLIIDQRDWSASARTSGTPSGQEIPQKNVELGVSKKHSKDVASSSRETQSSGKLRPVQDIIARIKWDEDYNEDEYLVGYEDRFAGVMEIDLMNWKTEQTDLEFIPLHRIVWIKQKGQEGEKVWDRRTKYDAIFHSGVPRGAEN